MRKIYFLLLLVLFAGISNAQLTGTKTIPGDYASVAAAVTDLNAVGVGAGGVTFNVDAGYTESITAAINITATGTSANPVVFQKSGSGANPKITRTDAGSLVPTALGAQGDAVLIIQGADYLTFDGIDVAATDAAGGIEYGYYLRKASVTDGCKNVTIKNAAITMVKAASAFVAGIYSSNNDAASLVTSATGITVTSIGGRNENVSITGNTISNVFSGIVLRGFNHTTAPNDFQDQNYVVTGNTIQNYAGNAASASYGVYLIYHTSPNVSNNTIGNAAGGGSNATSTLYGIFNSSSNAGGAFVANNNAITLSQGSTSGTQGIYVSPACTSVTVNNNTFSVPVIASTSNSYLIYCSNATPTITVNGNATSGAINKTGAGGFYGYYNFGSPTSGTVTISNNNFSNITLTGASTFYGIYQATSTTQVEKVQNNTVSGITGGSSQIYGIYVSYGAAGSEISGNVVSSMSAAAAINGIQLGTTASTSISIFGNRVNTLSSTGASLVIGILHAAGTTSNIYKNKVYDLQGSNASSTMNGIQVSGGTTVNVYNNYVGDLRLTTANAAIPLAGINISGGTTVNAYYNTVYLNASSTGALFGSAALYASSSTALTLKNNVLVNTSTPTGATGFTAAYRRTTTTLTSYGATSNSNDFYAGAPGANNVIFYDGTNSDQTLAAYKSRVATRDGASISENPSFVSTTGSDANYLHISTTAPTQLESGGSPVAGITDDFDGDTRNASTPDIGADEGTFVLLDINPPAVNYTPLTFTCSGDARTLTATISDPSGVPTSGAGLPVLYWKISAGAYTAVTGTYVSGSTYTFTFGAGAVLGDVVSYYIVAQDNATTPNISAFPSAGAGGYTLNPPAAATPPTTPSSYTINGTLSGIYTVGATGTYPTLTAAVADYNLKCLTGPVTFSLIDASYSTSETFPITINANPTASTTNTLTINPATGVTASISGAATTYLIRVLGSHVFINGSNNGSTSRDLTITNTSATTPGVLLIGSTGTTPIVNVAARNTIMVNGANTNTAVLVSDVSGAAGYFNNITLQNNSVSKAYIGLYAIATVAAGNGSGLNISNNDLSTSGANSIRLVGIYAQGVDGATIQNNLVGNIANTADASNLTGIWLATGTVNTAVANNTIGPISGTSAGPRGILVSSGVANAGVTIAGNTVSGLSTPSSGTATGIYLLGATAGVDISGNSVSNIKNSNTLGYGSNGIWLASTSTAANTRVFNNFIWDVTAYGYTLGSGSSDNGYGMIVSGGAGYAITYNTVLLNTNQTVDGLPSAFNVTSGVTAVGALDVRNNILATTQSNGTDRYAIYSGAANTVFSSINNNDYWSAGPNLGYISSNRATLADIQTGFGGNTNSKSVAPIFVSAVSPINLHLSNALGSNLCFNGAATPIAGITTDIDGDTRNVTTPDMGADEFNPTLPTFVVNNQSACFGNTVDLTAAAVTLGSAGGQTFTYFTDAACTNAVATPAAVGAGTYYIKATYTSGGCSTHQISSVVVTINALPTVSLTVTETSGSTANDGTICAGDAATLTASGAVSYTWAPGGETTAAITVTPASNTTYTVTGTDANGCQNTATTTITVNALPTASIAIAETSGTTNNDGTICAGASVSLTASGGTSYLWSDGSTTAAITVSPTTTTTYTVTVTDGNGCSATSNTTITVNALPTTYNVTGGGAYCSGGVGSAVGLSNSEVGVNYQLVLNGINVGSSVSGTGSAISFGLQTAAGTYTVVATNATTTCTNNMTGSVTVSINALPTITRTLTEPTTCATNDGGAALTLGGAAGPYTFNWTGLGSVQGQQNQTTLYTGTYSVIVTAANGCQASSSFTLIGPGGCFVCPTVAAVSTTPAAICQGGTATLSATGLADMGISYGIGFVVSATPLANPYTGTIVATVANGSLTNGGSTATSTYAFNTPGTQYVYAILSPSPADPACRPFQATQINVVATPDVNAVANQTVCSGAATTAVAFSGTVPGTVYTWTNNTTSIGLAASGTGNIPSFTATNFTNVPVTATVTVTPNNPIPTQGSQTFSYTGAAQTWTVPAGVTSIDVEANGAQGGRVDISGYWSPCCLDGGLGGKVQSKLAVTPGQVLSIYVGGIGFTNGTGGYNGGGTAAQLSGIGKGGAGGGGATDLRIGGTALSNRVIVAGAGGGAGGDGGFTAGGVGGGLIGGAPGTPRNGATVPATGGTQTAGGTGGSLVGFSSSGNGSLGLGGNNLSGDGVHSGGGAGYYGGGGGTWAGGAGGSSYTDPTLCSNVTHVQGANTGDGSLKISYNIASSVTCPGPSKTFTITVNPVPSVNTVADVAGCNGSTVSVPFTGFVPGTVYEWTNSNTAIGLAASGNGNISFTGTNSGSSPITGTIIVTPKYTNNGVTCTGTPVAFTITINPTPTVNAVASETLCSGGATTAVAFSGAVTGTVYNWTNNTPSIGLAATGTGNIASFTAINTGTAPVVATITVTPEYTNVGATCTGTPTTYTITVLPTGQVNTVSNQVVCNGDNTSAVTFATANTGGTTTYSWTNNTPSIGLAASGTGNIASFVGVNTGTTPVTATITVTPTFTASLGSITNLVSNGGFESGALGAWTLAGANSGGGCDQGFVVYSGNVNNCNFSAATCNGAPLNYTQPQGNYGVSAAFDGAGPLGREIRQQITLPASLASASLKFMNQYDVDLQTYCAGCTGTRIMEVNLLDATGSTLLTNLYNVTLSPGAKYCVPWNTQNLNVLSAITPYLGQNVTLSFKLTIPESFTGPGWIALDSVALNVVSTSCPGTPRTFTITVNPTPTVNAVSNEVVCNGANTTAVTFGGAVAGTVYSWTNNTTSIGLAASGTGNIASFAAVNTGTTPVTATITVTPSYTNGGVTCTGTPTSYTITVNPTPTVNTVANQAVCNGSNTTAVTFSGAVTGTVYNWTNNTTSIGLAANGTGNIASFVGVNTGTTPVVATITVTPSANGCSGTPSTFTITVNPTPTVNAVSNQVICNGSNTTAVAFSGAVTGTVYSWTNNTTSIGLAASGTGNIASFAAVNTGTTPVTATITVTPSYTNGGVTCTGTPTTFTITVNPTPTVNVVANQVLCNGSSTTAVTFTGAVAGTVYTWTNTTTSIGLAASGTGNIASFVGVNAGTAPVVATITVTPSANGCSGTPRTFTITVNPTPTVNVVANQVVCNRSNTTAVAFTGAVTGTVYNWTNNTPSIGLAASGTGDIAAFAAVNTTQTPVVATITVTPSFTNGGVTCLGTPRTFTITVNPTPIVSATDLFNQRICISDGPVALNATPVGGTWSGIGVSGFNFIPSATAVGNFILTYTYTNQYGCTTTDTTTAKVSACDERNISLASGGAVLFPNPNGGQFNIRVNSTRFQYLQMRIYNQLGQLISTKQWSGLVYGQILPVNMNHLPAAVYTVRIIYDGGNLYEDRGYKMIIQH